MKQTKEGTEIDVKELVDELNDGICHYRVEIVCSILPLSISFAPEKVLSSGSNDNVFVLHSKGEDITISRVSKVLRCEPINNSNQLVYKVTTYGLLGQKINIRIIRHFGLAS